MSGLRFFEFGFRRSRCPPNRRVRTHTATLRLRVLIGRSFMASRDKMHAAMPSVQPSGDNDVDFTL